MAKAAGEGNDIGLEEQAPNEASIEAIPEPEQDEAEIAEPIEAEAAESAGEQSG